MAPKSAIFREFAVIPWTPFAGDSFSRNLLTAVAFDPARRRQFSTKSALAYLWNAGGNTYCAMASHGRRIIDTSIVSPVFKIRFFSCWTIRSTKYLAFQHICWTEPKVAGLNKTARDDIAYWLKLSKMVASDRERNIKSHTDLCEGNRLIFFSLVVRGHPRDLLQRKIASFTLTNHDDNERKRIALKYTMLCGCGTVFVGMTVSWKLLPDRRTTKVRASVGPTTILPVRVHGPALILKTVSQSRVLLIRCPCKSVPQTTNQGKTNTFLIKSSLTTCWHPPFCEDGQVRSKSSTSAWLVDIPLVAMHTKIHIISWRKTVKYDHQTAK